MKEHQYHREVIAPIKDEANTTKKSDLLDCHQFTTVSTTIGTTT
jgi:hypothetical protein